jgi:hypothetical protein
MLVAQDQAANKKGRTDDGGGQWVAGFVVGDRKE